MEATFIGGDTPVEIAVDFLAIFWPVYVILKQNSLAVKKGAAKESRINLTLTRLITTRTDISVWPRSMLILELYSLYC